MYGQSSCLTTGNKHAHLVRMAPNCKTSQLYPMMTKEFCFTNVRGALKTYFQMLLKCVKPNITKGLDKCVIQA